MSKLKGKICMVTGASGDVGGGAATGLGEAGATVYLTARTLQPGNSPIPWRGSLTQAVEDIEETGGVGIAHQCDHRDDNQVRAAFDRIRDEQGRLDVLVNVV